MLKFMKKTGVFILEIAFVVLSAFLSSLAFPGPFSESGISFIAFFSLVPVFYIIDRTSWAKVPFLGAIYGFVFYLFYNYWLKTFHELAIFIAPSLEALQYLILFPILKSATSLFKRRGYLVQSIFYVSYLYLTQQGFLAYPYGNLSAAVFTYTRFIQSVDIFGIWGISLLMVLPQTLVAEILKKKRLREYLADIYVIFILFSMNYMYGIVSYDYYSTKNYDDSLRIATVQHSADTWKGGYSTYKANFETLCELSEEAMKENPDVVAWSETAFVPSVSWHKAYPSSVYTSALCDRFVEFGKNLGVPLITGNPEGVINDETLPPFLENGDWNWKTYNTVILFSDGDIKGTYRKQHLVPFTEYFPFEDLMPKTTEFLRSHDFKWWETGEEATVFTLGDVNFSTPICFEDTFGYLSAEFVKNGADFLLNVSNDVWSGSVPAEVQHMQLAVFRALENRRSLLRSTNSGITCLVTPSGDIVDPLEPFIKTWHIYEVPIDTEEPLTFYTRHVDVLPKTLCMLSLGLFLFGLYKRHKSKKWVY